MDSRAADTGDMIKHGEAPAFAVSAQAPSRSDHRDSAAMFNPVMRMPPAFQRYYSSTHASSPGQRAQQTRPRTTSKELPPAPLTFIEQRLALHALDQPNKRRRFEDKSPPPPKYRFSNRKTPFSIQRPLKNADIVHKDVWTAILGWSTPRFLLQAKTVCSLFYEILSKQSLWRQARLREFPTSPPCPDGITEQQYADLLVGRGCQNPSCRRENTLTPSFAILARFCPECLLSKTTRLQDLPASRVHPIGGNMNLCDCLAMLSLPAGHRGEPREVRTDEDGTLSYADAGRPSTLRFLKSSYDRLEAEYLELRGSETFEAELNAWWEKKHTATMVQMKQRGALHRWSVGYHHSTQAADIRMDRETFFTQKAQELDPPISRSTLNRFAAFKNALATQNPPTDRSWETLKSKILPVREQAEELDQALKRIERPGSDSIWESLATHRRGASEHPPVLTPEQDFVIHLARKEFERCVQKGVSDADLVLLTLKNVWDRYYAGDQRPHGMNFDGKKRLYELSLDDCRLILDLVIKKEIPGQSQRGTKVYGRFRCPACIKAKDRGRLFSFTAVFEHLLNHHAVCVGEGSNFWRFALAERPQRGLHWYRVLPFPWYTLRWPRCLPVLPEHQDPVAHQPWDPDSTRSYIQESRNLTSAFEGRRVNEQVQASTFLDFFTHAAVALSEVKLPGQAMTRIALKFALDSCALRGLPQPSLTKFLEVVPYVQSINQSMDFRFRCGTCMTNGDQKPSSRHVKHNIPVDALHMHWVKAHGDQSLSTGGGQDTEDQPEDSGEWTSGFMHLPSDVELHDTIVESDRSLKREKENIRATSSARKKPRAKAAVILAAPFAQEAFGRLFPPVESA